MKDKIYLNIHPDWTEGENEPEVTWSEVEDPFYNNIPYIRKDALLEWAKETEKSRMRVPIEAYNNEDYQAGFIDGFAKFRRTLIEKLESL